MYRVSWRVVIVHRVGAGLLCMLELKRSRQFLVLTSRKQLPDRGRTKYVTRQKRVSPGSVTMPEMSPHRRDSWPALVRYCTVGLEIVSELQARGGDQ